jgi:hypothetical protein
MMENAGGARSLRRAVIPHVDDLGGSHGANAAFLELAAAGMVTCGSVMVPGPWFRELAEAAAADPRLDVGVHLTLTSEWRSCRWAPLSTTSRASGLIDHDGYFWDNVASLRAHLVPEAAELEMRAQIERALGAGFAPTHIDAHMAAAMLPQLLPLQLKLGHEFGLTPILPRSISWAPDQMVYGACVDALHRDGGPVIDHCRGTLPVADDALAPSWRKVIMELPAGRTHLALHCTAPGDFAAMAPAHAAWRFQEYAFIKAGGLRRLCEEADVGFAATRELQTAWQNRWPH